ncbi:hypothetical protein M0802_000224 [Mischocyttarus mexicanus]|nr:hypothetical protein M0802_000224 [Mischocyttarus mexicanus]
MKTRKTIEEERSFIFPGKLSRGIIFVSTTMFENSTDHLRRVDVRCLPSGREEDEDKDVDEDEKVSFHQDEEEKQVEEGEERRSIKVIKYGREEKTKQQVGGGSMYAFQKATRLQTCQTAKTTITVPEISTTSVNAYASSTPPPHNFSNPVSMTFSVPRSRAKKSCTCYSQLKIFPNV